MSCSLINDWYVYGARFYDPALARFPSLDPLADEFENLSPYNYASNNPVTCIDLWGLQGVPAEEIRDDQGNFQGYSSPKSSTYIRPLVEPIPVNPGYVQKNEYIRESKNLIKFEMWLDSPSETFKEAVGKIGANFGYSFVNSPKELLTGKSWGGTPVKSVEKTEAFIDVAPAVVFGALTKTVGVFKTSKGLKGFNDFVKRDPTITSTGGLPEGMTWQKHVGEQFQINKVNQNATNSAKDAVRAITGAEVVEDEINEN